MPAEKKVFPQFKIYAPADLRKKWFVYWYEGSIRHRKYGAINQHDSIAGRQLAAEQLVAELKAEARRKVSRAEESIRAYIDAASPNWSPRTVEQYSSVANVFFDYLAGRELTQARLEEFLQHIRHRRHATTYNKYVAILQRLFQAAKLGYSLEEVPRAKAISKPARYFQIHQSRRLLRLIDQKDEELGLFVRFMYYCFLRPKELRWLRAGDVLLEEGEIRVPGNISKNSKTQFVVIPAAFTATLSFLFELEPGRFIFPSQKDVSKPVSKNNMYRRHRAFLEELGFGEGYTLYSWKHTGAVRAAKAGVSIKELQLQLRHHSLDETDKYLRQMGVKDLSKLQQNFPPPL